MQNFTLLMLSITFVINNIKVMLESNIYTTCYQLYTQLVVDNQWLISQVDLILPT
jgi:hypothetical protein